MLRSRLTGRKGPVIWGFHGVTDAAWFRRCIRDIRRTWEIVPLSTVAENRDVADLCAITFDDGLRSIADVADPVLFGDRAPYTIFVCTDVLTGGRVPWVWRVAHLIDAVGVDVVREQWALDARTFRNKYDVIIGLKQVPIGSILGELDALESRVGVEAPNPTDIFLSRDQLQRLSERGATIGSHSHRHPTLSLLPVEEQRMEIDESLAIIRDLFGAEVREFAYPNGTPLDFDATTTAELRAAGVGVAVTTSQGYVTAASDPLALPRLGVDDGEPPARLLVKTLMPWLSRTHARERALRSRVPTHEPSLGRAA